MKRILIAILILGAFVSQALASGDERAPIQEKEFKYNDWTFKNLRDGSAVNLRSFGQNKKLVLVVYFAAWCPNWRNEIPVVKKLYDKYKDKGFDVIAVSEYASLEETKKNVTENNLTFTVVAESEKREDRDKTTHYQLRQAAGDTRKWGSPWNVFLEPQNLKKKGDVLTNKAFVVNGELIESEVEAFIRQKLKLPTEPKQTTLAANKKDEVCDTTTELKKP